MPGLASMPGTVSGGHDAHAIHNVTPSEIPDNSGNHVTPCKHNGYQIFSKCGESMLGRGVVLAAAQYPKEVSA